MRAYESCKKLVINTSRTDLVRYFHPELPPPYQSFPSALSSLLPFASYDQLPRRVLGTAAEFPSHLMELNAFESRLGYNHVEDF
jgi:hypothetical protein